MLLPEGDRRPAFHDIDDIRPELRILDRNFAVIRNELDAVLAEKASIPRYHEVSARETYISGTIDPDKDWRVFMLRTPYGTPRKNQLQYPRTTELTGRYRG
jgi:hypothetical protein